MRCWSRSPRSSADGRRAHGDREVAVVEVRALERRADDAGVGQARLGVAAEVAVAPAVSAATATQRDGAGGARRGAREPHAGERAAGSAGDAQNTSVPVAGTAGNPKLSDLAQRDRPPRPRGPPTASRGIVAPATAIAAAAAPSAGSR